MVRAVLNRFNNSKLKIIFDNLGIKQGSRDYILSGDEGYISIKLYNPNVEFRQYGNVVWMFFGYDDNAGAWGGYTRKYKVVDLDIFKTPKWKQIIKTDGVKATPDVIMI